MDIAAIAERISQDTTETNATEAAALRHIIRKKGSLFRDILTDKRITTQESAQTIVHMLIAEAVLSGFEIGIAAGKHRERQRRRARA